MRCRQEYLKQRKRHESSMVRTNPMRPDSRISEVAAREAGLDDTIEQTFPASDPPSSIPNPCEYELVNDATEERDRVAGGYRSGRPPASR